MGFATLLALAGAGAGAVASVAGFGIGSILTPLLALHTGTKLAVSAVAVPHAVATAARFWMLRRSVDLRVLRSFGIMSAVGGLAGALLHTFAASPILTAVFAALLVFAGLMGLAGRADRMRFTGAMAWGAGAASGLFGGLVGNQGGIRAAALLGLDVPRHAFVATATATALIVDAVRLPIYLATNLSEIAGLWPLVAAATAGTLVGTAGGQPLLRRIPEPAFRRVVAGILLGLGIMMLLMLGR